MSYKVLGADIETTTGHVSISTMQLAKGLEFRAVAIMAGGYEVIPLQERLKTVGQEAGLEEVYETERQLFYVACTRALENLLVTGVSLYNTRLEDLKFR